MENLETLLQKVRQINDRFEDLETFNAFTAIGFINQERMHSNFIAEMLNPNGKHKMKNKFLKLFLQQVPLKNKNFDIDNATIAVEQRADSRWIDILITNEKNEVIVIENKIYAGDQDRQLEDYYSFCKNKYEPVEMVYLTLDGKKPTPKSVGPVLQMENVICISYKKHIQPWIDDCTKISKFRVKYTLEMYSELLSNLINKNKYMNEIFGELKKNKKNLKLAFEIKNSLVGRDFYVEFPEIKKLLEEVLFEFEKDFIYCMDYNNDNDVDFQLINEGEWWTMRFDNGEVYFTNEEEYKVLFYTSDFTSPLLEALLLEEKNTIYEILKKELLELKQKSFSFQHKNNEPSQSI